MGFCLEMRVNWSGFEKNNIGRGFGNSLSSALAHVDPVWNIKTKICFVVFFWEGNGQKTTLKRIAIFWFMGMRWKEYSVEYASSRHVSFKDNDISVLPRWKFWPCYHFDFRKNFKPIFFFVFPSKSKNHHTQGQNTLVYVSWKLFYFILFRSNSCFYFQVNILPILSRCSSCPFEFISACLDSFLFLFSE